MKHFLRLADFSKKELQSIFKVAHDIHKGENKNTLEGQTVILFFPSSSIRTRVTFEKGIHQLGGQSILFPSETLDKKEELKDVIGYLNNWADAVIVRHKNIGVMEELARFSNVPIINAMTHINHPCEILSDLFALSIRRKNYLNDNYLFMGGKGNIGLAWKEASEVFGFSFVQCCPKGYEMEGVKIEYDLSRAVQGKDIILTDPISSDDLKHFQGYTITKDLLEKANDNALLNPCPPFYRGEEVSEDVIDSSFFVGYEFKKELLSVQQAIILYCMTK